MSKKNFIKGATILTLAGIITRIFGFVFRIYLSRLIGAEGMGLYQLVMPVLAICYAVGIAGLEVSLSRMVAACSYGNEKKNIPFIAVTCTLFSLIICCICSIGIYFLSDEIAQHVFHNDSCGLLIRIMAFSIPFSCIHTMVSSYYLGKEKTVIPALSQLFEQIIRISSVYIVSRIFMESGEKYTAVIGILGLVCGEIGSCAFCITAIMSHKYALSSIIIKGKSTRKENFNLIKEIAGTSIPISFNRLSLHIMQSIEVALIPLMLQTYGFSYTKAIETFGIITGMALPVILFPSTLTNSVSVMLLPNVAREQHSHKKILKKVRYALLFSLLFGFACVVMYLTIGAPFGAYIFNESNLKIYIRIMAWLCPFMFISTTFKSILHAMGKAARVFANNMLSEILCLLCIVFLIPKMGIYAYLLGLLLSQFSNAVLNMTSVYKIIASFDDL